MFPRRAGYHAHGPRPGEVPVMTRDEQLQIDEAVARNLAAESRKWQALEANWIRPQRPPGANPNWQGGVNPSPNYYPGAQRIPEHNPSAPRFAEVPSIPKNEGVDKDDEELRIALEVSRLEAEEASRGHSHRDDRGRNDWRDEGEPALGIPVQPIAHFGPPSGGPWRNGDLTSTGAVDRETLESLIARTGARESVAARLLQTHGGDLKVAADAFLRESQPNPLQAFPSINRSLPKFSQSFTLTELKEATKNFSPSNLLGEGGFGRVYKGTIDGADVAVKQLRHGSEQGEREFRAEVEIISRVHHRHLVSLVGFCIEDSERILVYNFVPNGTLEDALKRAGDPIDWPTRVKIARGTARGLMYLHEDCNPGIIHRDIKASNILLDDHWEAQVSDFGLAKGTVDTKTHHTTRVMGTFGYMAPEYVMSGRLTEKADVFSFGVLLLELITGKQALDSTAAAGKESLVVWARPLLTKALHGGLHGGHLESLVDPRLAHKYNKQEMLRIMEIAEICVSKEADQRPKMSMVVHALESDGSELKHGHRHGHWMLGLSWMFGHTHVSHSGSHSGSLSGGHSSRHSSRHSDSDN